jgi:hypothetical protein
VGRLADHQVAEDQAGGAGGAEHLQEQAHAPDEVAFLLGRTGHQNS